MVSHFGSKRVTKKKAEKLRRLKLYLYLTLDGMRIKLPTKYKVNHYSFFIYIVRVHNHMNEFYRSDIRFSDKST